LRALETVLLTRHRGSAFTGRALEDVTERVQGLAGDSSQEAALRFAASRALELLGAAPELDGGFTAAASPPAPGPPPPAAPQPAPPHPPAQLPAVQQAQAPQWASAVHQPQPPPPPQLPASPQQYASPPPPQQPQQPGASLPHAQALPSAQVGQQPPPLPPPHALPATQAEHLLHAALQQQHSHQPLAQEHQQAPPSQQQQHPSAQMAPAHPQYHQQPSPQVQPALPDTRWASQPQLPQPRVTASQSAASDLSSLSGFQMSPPVAALTASSGAAQPGSQLQLPAGFALPPAEPAGGASAAGLVYTAPPAMVAAPGVQGLHPSVGQAAAGVPSPADSGPSLIDL